jgi:Fibrinogen beta and gamma chains, C-terminal globular domain
MSRTRFIDQILFVLCNTSARDCAVIRALGVTTNGAYSVYLGNIYRELVVYCDMTTTSAGWTVLFTFFNHDIISFRVELCWQPSTYIAAFLISLSG